MDSITIKPDREYLREVCDKIDKNRFAVPIFQRDFVWTRNQILELFDSIKKGYPIGSLVLWHSDEFHISKNILTDERIDAPAPEYYILDGRQRLTTFYGCISTKTNKNPKFNLGYDLEDEVFCFDNDRTPNHPWISISDAFDTFRLIGWLTSFVQGSNHPHPEEISNRAKKLNTILQTYTIGEFYIDNCSLQESTEVFSRINSTGTKINDVEMLQALLYDDNTGGLMKSEIESITDSLSEYDFQDIRTQDILYCCYQFVGLNYYESNLEQLIKVQRKQGVTLLDYMPQIRRSVIDTVRFLHDECCVLNSQLLPYTRQFIELTHFFRKVEQPTPEQLAELKRWFFYTTITQSFLNGSLSNARAIHNKLNDFIEGKSTHAVKYQVIELNNDFNFRFSVRSAISSFMMLAQIHYYLAHLSDNADIFYRGYYTLDPSPLGRLPLLESSDKLILASAKRGQLTPELTNKYAFTQIETNALASGDMGAFLIARKKSFLMLEREFLTTLGIEVKEDPIFNLAL